MKAFYHTNKIDMHGFNAKCGTLNRFHEKALCLGNLFIEISDIFF